VRPQGDDEDRFEEGEACMLGDLAWLYVARVWLEISLQVAPEVWQCWLEAVGADVHLARSAGPCMEGNGKVLRTKQLNVNE
jgi:hypothetical protein